MDMKSISQKLQDDIRAIMEAGLHPNQQRIDVHEPEKDEITAHDFKKLRAMKKTKDGKVHNCATHVEHAVLGKGTTVSEQHAEPDANGNIEWYTVQFENSIQKVLTKDLTITMSEAHVHESAEEQVDEEEKKKPVSPFDWKNRPSELAKKPGETAGFDSKKISTGTVYTKKPVKEEAQIDELSVNTLNRVHGAAVRDANDASRDGDEARADKRYNLAGKASNKAELKNRAAGLKPSGQHALESVEQKEYTFADYLEAARAQYVDEDAVLVANEAFKNKDITLFIDQSQSPEA
jgi:hypothetical protein